MDRVFFRVPGGDVMSLACGVDGCGGAGSVRGRGGRRGAVPDGGSAGVIPVMTAAVISSCHRDMVRASVRSSGMSSCWAHQS